MLFFLFSSVESPWKISLTYLFANKDGENFADVLYIARLFSNANGTAYKLLIFKCSECYRFIKRCSDELLN